MEHMSLLIHQTNRKPFMLQGPTSSHTPHLHPLMRRTSQGKELQKRSAQRSKARLLPLHPHPKMTVLKTRSLSCPLMNTTISSFHPLPKRNVQRTISLFLMEMNSSSMRLSPFYPITEMSAHRRIPSPSCLLKMNFLTRMSHLS